MVNPQKRKGDAAEREAADLLASLTGFPVRRQLGAGRADDVGDLDGIPDTVVQVASWSDVRAAAVAKPRGAEQQRQNAGVRHAATMVRFRGGTWRVILTPEQWAALIQSAVA